MKNNTPVIKKGQPDDNHKFQPLPGPTGAYPYHLPISKVFDVASDDRLCFHMLGDTGSVLNTSYQHDIVKAMAGQYRQGQFLYHLGDLVYHFGEAAQYEKQFFKPYEQYPGPVFAIAGNHDSDVNPDSPAPYQSLDAFTRVFCDSTTQKVPFGGNSARKSMTQPNIYFTLETPLATFIGLHSNVPKYGIITAEQEAWFREELQSADRNKILIVCLHHSPYSADINHGSSLPMIAVLENAFAATGIRPDIVFSGHVHNYQRFSKHYPDGTQLPFIVAGAGGFDELHSIAATDDERFTAHSPALASVKLENYCDSRHGFLNIRIEKHDGQLLLHGDYFALSAREQAELIDSFSFEKTLR